jgi:hypothetical protein
MPNYVYIILNSGILIPAIIALVQFRSIDKRYYPFLCFLWIGCLNEILNIILVLCHHTSIVNSNVYVVVESGVLLWFFLSFQILRRNQFIAALSFCAAVWLIDNFWIHPITQNSTYFRICYSFLTVFLSMNLLNQLIFSKQNVTRHPLFLISLSFIIYYTYKALIQAFVLYGITKSSRFLFNLYVIMIYINFGINLLYALVVLWISRKHRSISPYLLPLS